MRRCIAHDRNEAAECTSCHRVLCQLCWTHTSDGEPWCAHCVDHAKRRWPWALPSLVVVAGLLALMTFMEVARVHGDTKSIVGWVSVVGLIAFVWYAYYVERNRRIVPTFHERQPEDEAVFEQHTGGYREAPGAPRPTRELVPPLSADEASISAIVGLLAAGLMGGYLLPEAALGLRVEITLFAMFAVIMGGVTWVIYRGHAVADDLVETDTTADTIKEVVQPGHEKMFLPHHIPMLVGMLGASMGPGAIGLILVLVPVFLFFGLAWGAALAVPVLYVGAYAIFGKGLVAISRLHRHKRGNLGASLLVGLVAGLVFILPIAGVAAAVMTLI